MGLFDSIGNIASDVAGDVGDVVSSVTPASVRNAIGEGLAIAICPPAAVAVVGGFAGAEAAKDVVGNVAPHSGLLGAITAATNTLKSTGTAIASNPVDVAEVAAGTALVATGIGGPAGAGLIAKGAAGIGVSALVPTHGVTSSPPAARPVQTLPAPNAANAPSKPARRGFWAWLKGIF